MAYVISDECVSCGTCESECPAGAISQGDAWTAELVLMPVLQALSARVDFSYISDDSMKGSFLWSSPFSNTFYTPFFFFPFFSEDAAASLLAICCLLMAASRVRHLSSPSFLA